MTNDPPNERRPRTGWGPPPEGYGQAEQVQPEEPARPPAPPPPPPSPPRPGAGWQQSQPYQPPQYAPQYQPPPYQQPPPYPQAYGPQYPPPPKTPPGRVLSIIAFVLAGIALIFLPPFFALAGVILAVIAMTKADPLGKWALAASITGGVLGMVIGLIVASAMD